MADILLSPIAAQSFLSAIKDPTHVVGGAQVGDLGAAMRWTYFRLIALTGAIEVADQAALTALDSDDVLAAIARPEVQVLRVTVLDDDGNGNPRIYRCVPGATDDATGDIFVPDDAGALRWFAETADVPTVNDVLDASTDGLLASRTVRATLDLGGGLAKDASALFGPVLPANLVFRKVDRLIVTQFATENANAGLLGVGIDTDDEDGIVAPIAVNDGTNPWDPGWVACIQDGNLANVSAQTATATRRLRANATGENFTAGKALFFGEYVIVE